MGERRPLIQALAGQQDRIDQQGQYIERLRNALRGQGGLIRRMAAQIDQLAIGLEAALTGNPELQRHVAAAMSRQADIHNPTQPVPEPPAQPAPFSTEETKTPEAFANVSDPGLVPGSTNDVAADTTSTVYTPGQDVPGTALKNLVDVTAPVAGTQGPQPLGDVKTLTDVRVGDPMNPQPAFPLRGDFANAQRTSSLQGEGVNTMAALRLAKLRIEAGTAESADELEEVARIQRTAGFTTAAAEFEIGTLESVKTAAVRRVAARERHANLVPRTAGTAGGNPPRRSAPSMQNAGAPQPGISLAGAVAVVDHEMDDSLDF